MVDRSHKDRDTRRGVRQLPAAPAIRGPKASNGERGPDVREGGEGAERRVLGCEFGAGDDVRAGAPVIVVVVEGGGDDLLRCGEAGGGEEGDSGGKLGELHCGEGD